MCRFGFSLSKTVVRPRKQKPFKPRTRLRHTLHAVWDLCSLCPFFCDFTIIKNVSPQETNHQQNSALSGRLKTLYCVHQQNPHRSNLMKLPVLFLGHGNPMTAIEHTVYSESWLKERLAPWVIPIQKSKLTRRRAADSTDSTARRDNEVRLFFWIGISGLKRLF